MPDAETQPTGTSRADQTIAQWREAAANPGAAPAIGVRALDETRLHTEVGDDRTRALFYRARCGKQALEEAQLLRLNHDGLITEITLFGRPLPGLTAVMRRIVPLILGRQGKSHLGAVLGAATVPLHAITTSGEQRLVPLASPYRKPGSRGRRRVHRLRRRPARAGP